MPIIKASKKDFNILNWVLFICYPIWFKKIKIYFLINFGTKVNTMTLGYASKLDLKICSTNVEIQKINGFTLKTFKMVLTSFQIENKLEKTRFF